MMASDYIIDVTEVDFESQVLAYSAQVPVVVDFWAEWCGPCRTLGPLLERLAQEGGGSFRLAKVNVDENPNLAIRYAVRSIPAVKAFRNGEMIAEFLGVQPEPRVREFLRALAPNQAELILEKGHSLLEMQQARQAEQAFRQALEAMPDNTNAMLGLTKSLLLQGNSDEALDLLAGFPASREYAGAERLRPVARALVRETGAESLNDDDPLEAAYHHALRLVKRGNVPAALDGMLDILRQDKRYRDGEAHQMVLGLLELLGDTNPLTRQYRNELASVLF